MIIDLPHADCRCVITPASRCTVDRDGHPYEQTLLDLLTDYHNKEA